MVEKTIKLRQALLTAVAIAPTVAANVAAHDSGAGAELLALREPFLAAWREEFATGKRSTADEQLDGAFEAAFQVVSDIVDRIEALPATTVTGLGVKALALSWTHSGLSISLEEMDWGTTTDMRLCVQIVSTLIEMTGGVEGGLPKWKRPMSDVIPSNEYRALTAYEEVPAGCKVVTPG